jgi:hypothetical protein
VNKRGVKKKGFSLSGVMHIHPQVKTGKATDSAGKKN